jgi:hypothetical protein
MYYITTKDTETGKKLTDVLKKCQTARERARETAATWNTTEYLVDRFAAAGGIEGLKINPDQHNPKNWRPSKEAKGFFLPNRRTKEGKAIAELFQQLPRVSRREVNLCIGWDEKFKIIGVNIIADYVGIKIKEDWNIEMPKDCKEITSHRYREIFSDT